MLKWVWSEGGPLIMMDNLALKYWHGSDPLDHTISDYERACRIEADVELLPVGKNEALVFGGDINQMALVPIDDLSHGEYLLARWIYAPIGFEDARLTSVLAICQFEPTGLRFKVDQAPAYLFDAAYAAYDIPTTSTGGTKIALRAGTYSVTRAEYMPDQETLFYCYLLIFEEVQV